MSVLSKLLKGHVFRLLEKLHQLPHKKVYNLSISHEALILNLYERPFIAIEDSYENARKLYLDFLFFKEALDRGSKKTVIFFPPNLSKENRGLRCKALYELSLSSQRGVITSIDALKTGFRLQKIGQNIFPIKKGLAIERGKFVEMLNGLGYKEVSLVTEKGDYAQRNWLFDIYPVTEEYPIRVEFFGDEIEVIKLFDLNSQRTLREINEVILFPSEEGLIESNLIAEFHLSDFDVICEASIVRELNLEYNLPDNPISVSHMPFIDEGIDAGEIPLGGLHILKEERKSLEEIIEPLYRIDKGLILVLASNSQAQRIREVFLAKDSIIPLVERTSIIRVDDKKLLTTGNLSSGFHLDSLLILTEKEIFGDRPEYRALKKSKVSDLISVIDELREGDFVVHDDHGIGKFIKLQREIIEGYEGDLVILEYEGGDRLYIPIDCINRIKKFSASDGHIPSLNRLGSKKWIRTKEKVKESIKEMAEKLLHLYAMRKISKGFVFSDDTPLHHEFDEFFPYEETEDQIRAFEMIRSRMTSDQPMDILLCGDVGFGKTEVAMKAAFRAVYDGKQVAVIVPTTLLAEQHYRTFKSRFSPFPVNIDYVSRFKRDREIRESLTALSKGEIDIIIGTHILLKRDVEFHDLGLLIIDEEHRFGVEQKERLKEIKSGVDVLTLSATPIPRTLHMALSGIRDMVAIETPPEDRLAVRTFITKFNEKTIKEAIERELNRGGQVFFVHNRIKDIDKMADFLEKLIPNARIGIAHGRLSEIELEKTMIRFLDQKIDLLLCTAIIGSGLDILNANTLIVNRADKFGLADLYQLKGRVGRSSRQAYAYFMIPPEESMTQEAKKRLQALKEMSYLGAGLRLAIKDLEIRGTGNILGKEQWGHIHKIGFDTYLELLEKTVAEIKGHPFIKEVEPQVRLRLPAYIPEEYISDVPLRLSIYRRIAKSKSIEELKDLEEEIIDRFGPLPAEVNNILQIMEVRLYAKLLYITKIVESESKIRFFFLIDQNNEYNIAENFFERILKCLFTFAKNNKNIRFHPDGFEINRVNLPSNEALVLVKEFLRSLLDLQLRGSQVLEKSH